MIAQAGGGPHERRGSAAWRRGRHSLFPGPNPQLLARNSVQVILADQRMPGMSGSKLLGIAPDLYPRTVRIIQSGYTGLEAVTESVNQGAVFKFLSKPWNDVVLREHIRESFRRYHASA